jgi:hypothetical protein
MKVKMFAHSIRAHLKQLEHVRIKFFGALVALDTPITSELFHPITDGNCVNQMAFYTGERCACTSSPRLRTWRRGHLKIAVEAWH